MKFHRIIFIAAIIVYSLTAFFSIGYFHADEHYQIIEFAGKLDGTSDLKDLPWEYHNQIRPAIQPVIVYLIFKTCDFISLTDPYHKAFILRLITGSLALLIIHYFAGSCKKMVPPRYMKLFLVLTYFLWFLPFINVRCSSETWSGMFLLLPVALVIRNKTSYSAYMLIGGLLGLSFLFRYQIAFSVIGVILWLYFIRKEDLLKIGASLVSFIMVILVGVLIDSLYYGAFTLTLKNYFMANLVEGRAASISISPWYNYLFLIFRYAFYPVGTVILLSLAIVALKRYRNIAVWIILPFLIAHSFISHKEMRFLFPLINLIPLLIVMALDAVSMHNWNYLPRNIAKVLLIAILCVNFIFLAIACIKPAGKGRVRITQCIHRINDREKLNILHTTGCNPYTPWRLITHFYKEDNARFYNIDSSFTEESRFHDANSRTVLVFSQEEIDDEQIRELIKSLGMKESRKSMPEFIIPFLQIYGNKSDEIFLVYSN